MSAWTWIKNQETEFWNCLNYGVMTLSEQPPWCPLPHLGNKGVGLSSICFRSHPWPWAVADVANWAIALVYLNCPISHSVTPDETRLSCLDHVSSEASPGSIVLWFCGDGILGALALYVGLGAGEHKLSERTVCYSIAPWDRRRLLLPSAPTRCPVHRWLERAGQESRAA